MAKIVVSFSVDDQADRAIVQWLDRLPKRQKSVAIREALRAHLSGQGVTLGDVYQVVKELERKLSRGAVVVGAGDVDAASYDEPPDVAAALDNLGL